MPGVKIGDIQTALVIFIALLLEVGSGLGMFIAFSQWRIFDRREPAVATKLDMTTVAAPVTAPIEDLPQLPAATEAPAPITVESPKEVANDNKTQTQREEPETDIERYRSERVEDQDGSSLTVSALYEDYCEWCEEEEKEPLALPTFGREFGELGVEKAKIAGRVRYIGIALTPEAKRTEDKNSSVPIVKAA